MPELSADLYGTVSHKLDALAPSGIRAFNKEVSKIPGIIKLTLGEPDMATPEHVKQAAIKSIEEDDSHYAPQMGKPELLRQLVIIFKKHGMYIMTHKAKLSLLSAQPKLWTQLCFLC